MNPDPNTWYSERRIGSTDYGLRWNEIFGPTALLAIQGSRHQDKYALTAPDLVRTRDQTCLGGTPDAPCPLPPVDNFATGGFGSIYGPLNHSQSRRDQVRSDLNFYASNHEIKVGGDYQFARSDATSSFSGGQQVLIRNENGQTYYRHNFFARSLTDLTPAPPYEVHAKSREFGWYVQDSWRPARGWTVNLGLRWDQEDVIQTDGTIAPRTTNDWQPRVGIVWDPLGNGSTKIYAFAGRFYYSLPTDLELRIYQSATPYVQTYNFDPSALPRIPM